MAFRVNVRKAKSLLWLLCVLSFGGAGYEFYNIFSAKKGGEYKANESEYYEQLLWRDVDPDRTIDDGRTVYEPVDYERLWTARYDGSEKPIPVPKGDPEGRGPKEPEVVLETIDQVLKVSMVVWSDDPLMRFVGLQYLEGSQVANITGPSNKVRRIHLVEGEPLAPPYDADPYFGKVVAIDPQVVVFQWGEEEVDLNPNLGGDGTGVVAADFNIDEMADILAAAESAPDESIDLGDGHWRIGTKDQAEISNNAQRILEEDLSVRSVDHNASNRSVLELSDVRPDSIVANFGFERGDRIISVNGIPMPSMSSAINWGNAHPNEPVYDVLIERLGREIHIYLYPPG